jgi:CobQ-like glutamine amidotransferase family enzyme
VGPLRIWHLYSREMNIYGDRGNVIALTQRSRWRGIDVEVRTPDMGERIDADAVDLVFAGGGQDDHQIAVSKDLAGPNGRALCELAEDDVPMLLVCGTYQLFGHYFRTGAGNELPGIGLLDAHTVAGKRRMIGDALIEAELDGDAETGKRGEAENLAPRPQLTPSPRADLLVGFENHSGQTFLGSGCRRLGRVVVGGGNNGRDAGEGAVYRQVHGTYLHGPILPKNPFLTDRLIAAALRRRGHGGELPPLDDSDEQWAHDAIVDRIRRRGRRASGVV